MYIIVGLLYRYYYTIIYRCLLNWIQVKLCVLYVEMCTSVSFPGCIKHFFFCILTETKACINRSSAFLTKTWTFSHYLTIHSQTSGAKSPLNPSYTWLNVLIGLHYSPVVNIPLLLPSNSSILPLHLPPLHARELEAIIITTG